MKFFHLSDLHIGKQLHGYSLREDQEHILREVVVYAKELQPTAIIIAGDIYDKSVPSAEAVTVFDEFLTRLADIEPAIAILIISGNHDSADRLEYASEILERHHIFIAGVPPKQEEDRVKSVVLKDEWGEVKFYLLPFLKPGYVRGVFKENPPESYHEAVANIIERESIEVEKRNVLVSHQFYTGQGISPLTCDSETVQVGGIDNVDCSAVTAFDYVALGHIHGQQTIGQEHIRYCGTLLKYSVSEEHHHKGVSLVELGKKGEMPKITVLPLHPLHDVQKKSGTLASLLEETKGRKVEDYVSIVLTDEGELFQPKDRLEEVYTRILEIRVDNSRTKRKLEEVGEEAEVKDPFATFLSFYKEMQGKEMSEEEKVLLQQIIEDVKEG